MDGKGGANAEEVDVMVGKALRPSFHCACNLRIDPAVAHEIENRGRGGGHSGMSERNLVLSEELPCIVRASCDGHAVIEQTPAPGGREHLRSHSLW